jgi:hypothetical protein
VLKHQRRVIHIEEDAMCKMRVFGGIILAMLVATGSMAGAAIDVGQQCWRFEPFDDVLVISILQPHGTERMLHLTAGWFGLDVYRPNLANASWLLRTFGEDCPKAFVIRAVMQLTHFWGYHSDRFFNSIQSPYLHDSSHHPNPWRMSACRTWTTSVSGLRHWNDGPKWSNSGCAGGEVWLAVCSC